MLRRRGHMVAQRGMCTPLTRAQSAAPDAELTSATLCAQWLCGGLPCSLLAVYHMFAVSRKIIWISSRKDAKSWVRE